MEWEHNNGVSSIACGWAWRAFKLRTNPQFDPIRTVGRLDEQAAKHNTAVCVSFSQIYSYRECFFGLHVPINGTKRSRSVPEIPL